MEGLCILRMLSVVAPQVAISDILQQAVALGGFENTAVRSGCAHASGETRVALTLRSMTPSAIPDASKAGASSSSPGMSSSCVGAGSDLLGFGSVGLWQPASGSC